MKCLKICILSIILFLIQCSQKTESDNNEKLNNYLALGDSYTIGESVPADQCWPVQLVDSMRQAGFDLQDAEIIARTGWTTSELQEGIEQAQPVAPYGMVSLLIGVNNQYRGLSLVDYRREFRQLLLQAIIYADNKPQNVVVLSIPDWGVMPFAQGRDRERIAAEIDTFNAVNYQQSQEYNVHYIDITGISRQAAVETSLVAADGLHPSAKMYALWVKSLLPVAKQIYD